MAQIDYQIDILRATRRNILRIIENYSLEQLNTIPSGFNNNLLWNAGHVVATQQILIYGMANQEFGIPQTFIDQFRKGTAPTAAYDQEMLDLISGYLIQTPEILESDYKNGVFGNHFRTYQTSYGVVLSSIEEAITFNNAHEGLHFGYCLALRKLL